MLRVEQKLRKTPKDSYLRKQFIKLKRKYRSTCRKRKRKFKQNVLQKLETLYFSNDDDFWNLLKQIKPKKKKKKDKRRNNETLPQIILTKNS